jgi:hypothetical protein
MTTTAPLHSQAITFAEHLTKLLNATVTHGALLTASPVNPDEYLIAISSAFDRPTNLNFVPLARSPRIENAPAFGLKIRYLVSLDASQERLIVSKSWTTVFEISQKPRPVMRWEYVRDGGLEPGFPSKRKHSRHAAHLQIHGWSEVLSDFSLKADLKPKKVISGSLHNLHFPVGGRRFRPSIEDILEFLADHGFVSAFHPGGEKILNESRDEWLKIQLKAAISDDVPTAISALKELGHI